MPSFRVEIRGSDAREASVSQRRGKNEIAKLKVEESGQIRRADGGPGFVVDRVKCSGLVDHMEPKVGSYPATGTGTDGAS